jgi:DnaJ-class molecular chaperone
LSIGFIIFEHIKEGEFSMGKMCPKCSGTFQMAGYGKGVVKCNRCSGTGKVKGPKYQDMDCPKCSGTGSVECPKCHGAGEVEWGS